ncbi:N-formylglutamate amidohydrolase [Terasakiella sp. A23]|uniref:N-formylglutamate amidohydrolase n=1 Tax=Terasakiella sp. FCG-A23 TaxID=3080561 RepID=UPI0029548C5E|nr:N-formylglutamate amidohydrolase [Terasakiella sp. A23]MDV7340652.1 N-formylglutamate amidohydrolase [Terasakiella sp. A23]
MKNETEIKYTPLLGKDDPQPFEIHNAEGDTPLLLICDHASNNVPKALNNMGLTQTELNYHIGWDIGAAGVTRHISDTLNAPAVLCNYSRLVIDCNRQPGDPTSIPEVSDGIGVLANHNLTESDQVQRTEAIFWPYHHAVTEVGAHLWRKGPPPALFSIHSFTPELMSREEDRPWHVAVLWKRDARIAAPLIEILSRETGLIVGDNTPYSGWDDAYSIDMHGSAPGLPYCAIEIRQDLIGDKEGEAKWGKILSDALAEIIKDKSIFEVKHY